MVSILSSAQTSDSNRSISELATATALLLLSASGCGNNNGRNPDEMTPTSGSVVSTPSGGSNDSNAMTLAPASSATSHDSGHGSTGGVATSSSTATPNTSSRPSDSSSGESNSFDASSERTPTLDDGSASAVTGDATSEPAPPATCPESYSNPLIWEDLPDLEVFRVGDAYYYTASSFHHSPGAPVLRSYDLVHWEYVSHSVPALDFHPSYDLPDGDNSYVNGIWASTLRYRESNQTFYWMGCMHNAGGGWVFTAKSPEGPWEKHQGGCYYDMGLLIDDDDTMYVASGNNTISVAQLSADGFSQVKSQVVYQTPADLSGPLEGSRFYKINGEYYIFVTQYANGEYVLRSKSGPFGPYEMRPFAVRLPFGGAGAGGSPHQGGIIETQNGDWYYLGFNDAYPAGRLPVMAPMTWSEGWPSVTLVDGKWGASYPFPNLPCGSNRVAPRLQRDDFSKATLGAEWEWNHNPDHSKWSSGDGLTLQTATVTDDLYAARNTLTHRIAGPVTTATIELDYTEMQDGDVAGLAVLRDASAAIAVRNVAGAVRVDMINGINMNTSWQTTSVGTSVGDAAVSGGKVWLRAEANVRTDNGGGRANFSYSIDGVEFEPLGGTLTMNKDWQYFLGYRFGVFNYATQALGGAVTVSEFVLSAP